MKCEIWKNHKMWKLNNTVPNNQWAKKEIITECKMVHLLWKIFESSSKR